MKERSLFANSAWGISSHVLRGLAGLVFVPLAVSTLGLTGYGLYTIISLFSIYAGIAAQLDLGYPTFLINFLARADGDFHASSVRHRLGTIFSLLIIGNCLLLLITVLGANAIASFFEVPKLNGRDFFYALLLILVSNFASIYFSVGSCLWAASHRFAHIKKLETFSYFLFVGLALGLLAYRPSLTSLASAYLISQVFLGLKIALDTYLHLGVRLMPGKLHIATMRGDWDGWRPFFFGRLNGLAQRQSDITFVSAILGPHFVAVYEISMKIPSIIKGTMGRVSEILGPFAGKRRAASDLPFIKRLAESLISIEVAFGTYVSVTLFFFGDDISRLWLGVDQQGLGLAMFMASFINVVTPVASVLFAILLAQNKRNRSLTWWPTAISVVNLILTVPLTYFYGVNATILLTVCQFFVMSIVSVYMGRKDLGFSLKSTVTASLATLIPAAFLDFIGSKYISLESGTLQFALKLVCLQMIVGAVLMAVHWRKLMDVKTLLKTKA